MQVQYAECVDGKLRFPSKPLLTALLNGITLSLQHIDLGQTELHRRGLLGEAIQPNVSAIDPARRNMISS